ncbi:MAG: FG-GAP-like repeat-containing protein [Tahibacter sp.]
MAAKQGFVHLAIASGLLMIPTLASALAVVSISPAANSRNAPRNTSITIQFDAPLQTATVNATNFRVWGQMLGLAAGTVNFSNGNQTLTFIPARRFFPGEMVSVQLSHAIASTNASTLRQAGYALQFLTVAGVTVSPLLLNKIDTVSVRTSAAHTTLYGGAYADLNKDGWVDFMAINEESADLRVMLNRADGSGKLGPVLLPPSAIGLQASPSEVADFNNDGKMDIATSNTSDASVSILLGNADGTFAPQQVVAVGSIPHGMAALDVDGDADIDLVVSTEGGNTMSMMLNNGSGVFGASSNFDSGGNGEYALATGDMNGDGILDLVVGTRNDSQIHVLTGNGNATFTHASNRNSGGHSWKLVLGDVNNDGKLDIANVSSDSSNASILLGNGDGSLQAATVYPFGGSMVASDLGDLDGDGDLDWVVSSYGAGRWYVLTNNGSGVFTQVREILADNNASCASLYDFDNDGDLDLVLADEVADVVLLIQNGIQILFRDGFEILPAPVAAPAGVSVHRATADRARSAKSAHAAQARARPGVASSIRLHE